MSSETPRSALIVDDDQDFLYYLRTTLESEGYQVVSASDASEAFRRIREQRFSMVLTDLRLPEASGLDVLKEARKADPLSVGIVLTGHSSVASALEALRDGAYDYLLKPCAPDALLAALRRACEHYALRLALLQKTAQLEKLELKLEDKSKMIQNVSHELKNPLSVVYGYSAFLLRQPECRPEDLKKSLQSIHNNAERLGHLLEELIESSRLSSHKIELSREELPAERAASEALENVRFDALRREIELKLEISLPGALVHADPQRLHQIFFNLLGNALKFTPPGGVVTLGADLDGGLARFWVQDTGVGIAAEDMRHLFERFYQAETTRKSHQGLGLGLEICKGLVELHGGRIWADSAPGLGSTFFFTLPLCLPGQGQPPAQDAPLKAVDIPPAKH